MNLLYAAESIIKSRIDKYGFTMNTCIHDQSSENLDKFLQALHDYKNAVAEYDILQDVKNQVNGDTTDVTDNTENED